MWDWLFGTAHLPKELPADYGVEGPMPKTVVGQLIYPFLPPATPTEAGQRASAGEAAAARPR